MGEPNPKRQHVELARSVIVPRLPGISWSVVAEFSTDRDWIGHILSVNTLEEARDMYFAFMSSHRGTAPFSIGSSPFLHPEARPLARKYPVFEWNEEFKSMRDQTAVFSEPISMARLDMLCELLKHNRNLNRLVFQCREGSMDDFVVNRLALRLNELPRVKRLILRFARSDSYSPLLAKGIEALELSDCTVSDRAAEYIAGALRFNTTLRHLNINRDDTIGDRGVGVIYQEIRDSNTTLMDFTMYYLRRVTLEFISEIDLYLHHRRAAHNGE